MAAPEASREEPGPEPGPATTQAPRPKVDVAAVLEALDPFWTRAIGEVRSLTAEDEELPEPLRPPGQSE
jgi:hypothetical protein